MIKSVLKKLNKIQEQARLKLGKITDLQKLENLRIEYLGRKGKLNQIFKELINLNAEDKKEAGRTANKIKLEIERYFKIASDRVSQQDSGDRNFDETVPGLFPKIGSLHPITEFIDKIAQIFISMGFEIAEDREVETVRYNFDKLNISEDHPARDMWDTFYVKLKVKSEKLRVKEKTIGTSPLVLRTHTSPVQLRAMETRQPPVRLIVPGRVYRHEATDASHETNFYQLEGLVIDRDISVANMIYVLDQVLKTLFGQQIKIRIRPSFFPFVEPGHEVDMSCIICGGRGCSVCSQTGWLEMLGAGMVHPVVLKNMGVDSQKFSGFAFGMGIDRLVMLYYGIDDIRLFYSGDLRFLRQF
ncbi:MAG: phenylalanine--tRNA ligase subunit alpha [Patescibacteria group bacterium]